MILVMSNQHVCSGSLSHLEFQPLSAHYRHQWARIQLILNHRILSASGVSTKKTDQGQHHLVKSPRFSKLGRTTTGTPLRYLTFDALSSATTIGHQRNHQSLLNSNISKLIHDQGKQVILSFWNYLLFVQAKLHSVGLFQFLQCFVRV